MASTTPSGGSIAEGFSIQARVIGALILRELHTRYGRENIGYLWLIAEPMILATVVTVAHVSHPTHFGSDINPAPFAIVGYCIYIIFRGVFNRAEGAVEQAEPLLYHRMVSIFDILFSRALIDVIGCLATLVVLMILAILLGYAELPYRPLYLLGAIGMMAWWGFSLALIAAAVTYRSETLARQLHVISYLVLPISGAFYALEWLPPSFRNYLEWFPMPLIFEQARYGEFRSASPDFMNGPYVIGWCVAQTYTGLLLVRRLRNRIHA